MNNAILTLKTEGFKCFERGIYTEKLKECVHGAKKAQTIWPRYWQRNSVVH